MSRLTTLLAALVMLVCVASAPTTALADPSAGHVNFIKRHGPEFDSFTRQPTAALQDWMRTKLWRTVVFSPYFDEKTSWYANGWVYKDLYALYTDQSTAKTHPEWVLRDGGGQKLYIPFGCSNGTCPQYAADVGNPAFRAAWIAEAKAEMAHGYKGLWVDDVNLEFRVGNGNGDEVAPFDPRTGKTMTYDDWRRYVAEFLEQIRAALPGVEIIHNSIWFAVAGPRDSDPYVKRQIAAADYINIERGVNDTGLTGGDGEWSLNAVLAYIDRVHAQGRAAILDGYTYDLPAQEYQLANYFLVSNGRDGIGLSNITPDTWWGGYDTELGAAAGPRTKWQGLLRRDFENGMALVNEPGAPKRTVDLPGTFVDTKGNTVTSVTLSARQGAVLRREGAPLPVAPVAAPATAPTPATTPLRAATQTILQPLVPLSSGSAPVIGRPTKAVLVRGKVKPVKGGGKVKVKIQRKRGSRYKLIRLRTKRVGSSGRFRTRVARLKRGKYRVVAQYTGSRKARGSRSRPRVFYVRR
jgi:hypothetical protein